MGMRASADVVYGVDLGDPEYNESFVGYDDDFDPDGDGLYERLDNLIDEFRGAPVVDYGAEGWEAQSAARREWLEHNKLGLAVDSYGYEFAGTVITSASAGHVTYGAARLNGLTDDTDHDLLVEFIEFLEAKGLRFTDPEKRKPGWLLLASYG